ncbi:MAG: SH3 domain-containing protein [Anaerolineae bacterium]
MQCQNCSAPLPDQASFCNVCGTSQAAVVLCPQCGASLKPGQKYCIQCGAEASATRATTGNGDQKAVPPAPARGRSNRLPMLIGLVALLIIVAGAAGTLLLLKQRDESQRAVAQAAVVEQWQAAQSALTAGDPEKALGLIADIRLRDANFEPTAVKSLRITACTNLAQAAEGAADVSAAQGWWDCVLEEDPASSAARRGSQAAQDYLAGQAAWNAQNYAGAIAAWQPIYAAQPDYADLKTKLYDAHIAHGGALCAQQNLQDGQAQFAAARTIDLNRPEADAHLAPCQPTPTPTPTPLPGPHLAVVANTTVLRVRAGPGPGYLVLGRLEANTTVTITGRTEDAAWVAIQADASRRGWVSTEFLTSSDPFTAAPVQAAPPLLKSVQVAQALQDFSPEQGYRSWYYLISESAGSLKFKQMPWDGGSWWRWCCDARYDPRMRISDNGMYPSRAHDVAREWVSPYEGSLRISGRAYKDGRGGNGVNLRIVHKETTVWQVDLNGSDTTGTRFDVSINAQPGDVIYFIANARNDDRDDNTVFEPLIELQHTDGADQSPPVGWADKPTLPTPTPTSRPAAALCFEPRVRHYEEHKGCCAEVAGLVYNLQGKQFGPRGALVRIEGPPATNRYVREFGVDAGGGYSITALTVDTYTIWLKGTNIRSPKFEVKYPDWAKIRILVDFYQVVCH